MASWKPDEVITKRMLIAEDGKWPTMAMHEEKMKLRPALTSQRRIRRATKIAARRLEMHLKDEQRLAPLAMRCLTRGLRAVCLG